MMSLYTSPDDTEDRHQEITVQKKYQRGMHDQPWITFGSDGTNQFITCEQSSQHAPEVVLCEGVAVERNI